jgi:hypothetical protein
MLYSSVSVFSRYSRFSIVRARTIFLLDSYFGAGGYEDGSYLDWHPREVRTDDKGNIVEQLPKFKARRSRAYYYNVIKTVVDVPVAYVFQSPIGRDGHQYFLDFVNDCTGRGTSLNTMMEELTRYARLFGVMFFLIDKPKPTAPVETKGDELAQAKSGVRPRIIPIFPSDLCDFFIEDGKLKWVKVLERFETSDGPMNGKRVGYRIRIWTETEWFLYNVVTINEPIDDLYSSIPGTKIEVPAPKEPGTPGGPDDGGATLAESGTHDLGRVPLVGVYNQQPEFGEMFGTTDVFQSARLNRRIYNLCSELDEILRDQTFSILTIPTDDTEEPGKKVVGTTNGLYYKPTQGGMKPEFISPDGSCAATIRENITALRTEIYRSASMQYSEGVEQVRSGVSRQWNFDQTNRFLSSISKRCEAAEREAAWFVLKWMGIDPTSKFKDANGVDKAAFDIQYPDTFDVADLMQEIELADALIAMRISKNFGSRVAKGLVRQKFPDLTKEERDLINKEIDASEAINPPPTAMVGPSSSLAAGASLKARVRAMRGARLATNAGSRTPAVEPVMSQLGGTTIPTIQKPRLDAGA